ncbi:hypothetical protein [Ornithinimicrobium kibberense]|uniref:hypothetical protein n=1 Tax=Ornithinimicrobium kibberense TaxID=282060 RepID=UPI003606F401
MSRTQSSPAATRAAMARCSSTVRICQPGSQPISSSARCTGRPSRSPRARAAVDLPAPVTP